MTKTNEHRAYHWSIQIFVFDFEFLSFVFVSNFELRIPDFLSISSIRYFQLVPLYLSCFFENDFEFMNHFFHLGVLERQNVF